MSNLNIDGIVKLNSFTLNKPLPLDARTVVTEYDHLNQLVSGNKAYAGMVVYVDSTGADKGLYVYTIVSKQTVTGDDGEAVIEYTYDWRKVGENAIKNGTNSDGTSKAFLEYDDTLQAIKFVFN